MRGPLAALGDRLRRRGGGTPGERAATEAQPAPTATPALPADMHRGAPEFQRRLDDARDRLRRDIPPQPDDEQP